ncbi:hypothetical protein GXW78_23920 [Roseomonas terrae]|jgi:hypothetical protein|uniref:Uncharacterized protein n=1 Tax=Neoroseomonas terrae TaxID=424799 RepID=A0ABS5ENY3_9PROT|nr:hypothetical protein [Neoroseomonas terrae]MBR0652726.1 hypothetical protein [Neoroseomonas terrae]
MRRDAVMALAAAALLGGCGLNTGYSTSPPAPCPRIAILADGADLTRYRAGAVQDLAAMTSDARLIGFQAQCDYTNRRRSVSVAVSGVFELERGPAGAGLRSVALPWFAVVTDSDDSQVIDRQEFVTTVELEGNANRVRVQSRPVSFDFPVDERRVENHTIRLSFQVTPDQLAANRRRGPR